MENLSHDSFSFDDKDTGVVLTESKDGHQGSCVFHSNLLILSGLGGKNYGCGEKIDGQESQQEEVGT